MGQKMLKTTALSLFKYKHHWFMKKKDNNPCFVFVHGHKQNAKNVLQRNANGSNSTMWRTYVRLTSLRCTEK